MKVFLLLALAFAAVMAETGYGPVYPPKLVAEVEEYLHKVASEKINLGEQIKHFKEKKANNIAKLKKIEEEIIPDFENVQLVQNDDIKKLGYGIGEIDPILAQLEAELAGDIAAVDFQAKQLPPIGAQLDDLEAANTDNDAKLAKAESAFNNGKDLVNAKLDAAAEDAGNKVDELLANTKAFTSLVNSRKCYTKYVEVEVDPKKFQGENDEYFPDHFFGENVPSVYCAMQGFVDTVGLGKSVAHSYGPPEMFKNLAFSVTCKSDNKGVKVFVFDLSRGEKNSIVKAYVETRSCTYPPVSGPAH